MYQPQITVSLVFVCLGLAGCITDLSSSQAALDEFADGGEACVGGDPDLPYNLDIECGDSLVAVIAAFNQKTDGAYAFAPHPDATGACPFAVEGATIHKEAVEGCTPMVASEVDANTEGSKALGEDRIWISWCWYTDAGVECDTDHMTLRYSCGDGDGDGDGDEHDSTWPTVGPTCDDSEPEPDPTPECVESADCPDGEFCNDGSCSVIVL